MSFSFTCTACGKQYRQVADRLAGKKVRCSCGHTMRAGKKKPAAPARPTSLLDYDYNDLDQILNAAESAVDDDRLDSDQGQQEPFASSAEASARPAKPARPSARPVERRGGLSNQPLGGDDRDPPAVDGRKQSGTDDLYTRRVKFGVRLAGLAGVAAIICGSLFCYASLAMISGRQPNWWFATVLETGPLVAADLQQSIYLRPLEIINWIELVVGGGMILAGAGQLLNAIVFSMKHHRFVHWADELAAGLTLALIALGLATIYLNANYYSRAKDTARQIVLDQQLAYQQSQRAVTESTLPPIPESQLLEFESLVDAQSAQLNRFILFTCIAPLGILLASIYRLYFG